MTLELSTKLPLGSAVTGQPSEPETLVEILHKVADNYKPSDDEAREICGFMHHPGNICMTSHLQGLNLNTNNDIVVNARIIFSAVMKHKQYFYRTLRVQENQLDLIMSGAENLGTEKLKFDKIKWNDVQNRVLNPDERGDLLEMLILAKKAVRNLQEATRKMFEFKGDRNTEKFVVGFARLYDYKVNKVKDLDEIIAKYELMRRRMEILLMSQTVTVRLNHLIEE